MTYPYEENNKQYSSQRNILIKELKKIVKQNENIEECLKKHMEFNDVMRNCMVSVEGLLHRMDKAVKKEVDNNEQIRQLLK